MPKLVWRVKLVAELGPGVTTEVEVARLERDAQAGLADLGLRLAEAKQLTAAVGFRRRLQWLRGDNQDGLHRGTFQERQCAAEP